MSDVKFEGFCSVFKNVFSEKMVLLGVKELYRLQDDLKIIGDNLAHGRYPGRKICPPKKRRQCRQDEFEKSIQRNEFATSKTFNEISKVGILSVTVHNAKNLPIADIAGKSDPYCFINLGKTRFRTRVWTNIQIKKIEAGLDQFLWSPINIWADFLRQKCFPPHFFNAFFTIFYKFFT